jgi:cell division protein FtsQ
MQLTRSSRDHADAQGPALLSSRAPVSFGRSGLRIGGKVIPVRRGYGSAAAFVFLGLTGVVGWVIGGHYDTLRSAHGTMSNIAARMAGFPVGSVDITGVKDLSKAEVLAASGIAPSGSLLTLDVNDVRAKLKALPLVAEATVRKLYPDKVAISIVEREAFALWQQDGVISVVSSDGTVIDGLRDARFLNLPHVVGPGAQMRAKEYAQILAQVPELREQIRAGVLVSGRRWNIKLANGVEIKLPEIEPAAALKQLAQLDREAKVLSKDIIAVDMRVPGRAAFRLTEEAGATRREDFEKRLPKIRGRA